MSGSARSSLGHTSPRNMARSDQGPQSPRRITATPGPSDPETTGQGEECPVCYDLVATVDLNCTHKMCQGCATQWFQRSHTCPICREPVSYPDLRLAAIPVPMRMENLSVAVSAALQSRERAREAADAARALWQSELATAPVLTLEMQADFDDEYAALDYDGDDGDGEDDAVYIESLRERCLRGRQPVEQSNIVGW